VRRSLEELALAQFGEHGCLADAHAATLCFRFALAAILWVKTALDPLVGTDGLVGFLRSQLPRYGLFHCQLTVQVTFLCCL